MFFFVSLQKHLIVPPHLFGKHLKESIVERLRTDVEGTCSGRHGYILQVTNVQDLGSGVILDAPLQGGAAAYNVSYQAIVFRPFKGEVLDCVVVQISVNGFFAEAGPVSIFEDMKFEYGDEPAFSDGTSRVQKGSWVRLRIVGLQRHASEFHIIGEMKSEYLGVLS